MTERNIIPLRTIVSQIHKNTIGVHSENEFKKMKKKFARNKFLWRGYFLTIIQQDVKSGCPSARSGLLFRKEGLLLL